ncbi:hypothetical protein ACH42_10565 [Endozoicomonas sp. (ex Bugula neritina AB1)]|nr:hypothetical protein ACH42_10565 [Endozoicomonas sp. (ex Bugula neritina AB1)]
MSTRSRIAMRLENNRYRSVYCHFDGDLVGPILHKHYASEDQARIIINGGDLRSVWPDRLDTYQDRGDLWQQIRPSDSEDLPQLIALAWESSAEYLYYWQDDAWQTIELRGS